MQGIGEFKVREKEPEGLGKAKLIERRRKSGLRMW